MERGGKRTGAGRPPTGPKVKKYTVTLPDKLAAELEYYATKLNQTPNKFLTNLLKSDVNEKGWYSITDGLKQMVYKTKPYEIFKDNKNNSKGD